MTRISLQKCKEKAAGHFPQLKKESKAWRTKALILEKWKRSFYTTTLKDGKVVIVNMPKKSTFEKMQEISDLDEEEVDGKEVYKTMLSLMAEILSNNKNGERITAEYLESEEYDIEEIVAYINDYGDFVNSIKNNPN